jgi:hypothetical protein
VQSKQKSAKKTIGIEEKLCTISQLEEGEQFVDVCLNVRLAHSSVHTICNNADRFKEVLSQELKCLFVWQDYHSPI